MINKIDLRKAISSIAISNAKRNTIYRAFSDLDSITKEEFDSVKSDISKVVESMLTKDAVGKANGVASLDSNGSVPIEQLGNIDTKLFLIVRELPTTDIQSNKIYLVPNQNGKGDNVYLEYLYVEGVWEKVGEFKPEVDLSSIMYELKDLKAHSFYLGNNGGIASPFNFEIFIFDSKIQELKNNEEYAYADITESLDNNQYIYDKSLDKTIKITGITDTEIDTGGDFFRTAEPLDLSHTFYLDNEKTGNIENLDKLTIEESDVFKNLPYKDISDNINDDEAPQYIYDAIDRKWIEVVETWYTSAYYSFNTEEPLDLTHEFGYCNHPIVRNYAQATGRYSIALGHNVSANNVYAIALGQDTKATGESSIALGNGANVIGLEAVALGSGAKANGKNSIAIGTTTIADGEDSIVLGHNTVSFGRNSVILGNNAYTGTNNSVALGCDAKAYGNESVALGYDTVATGTYSIALGSGAKTSADNTIVIGKNNYSSTSACYSLSSEGKPLMEIERNNKGLYLQGFGGYDGTNLVTKDGDIETLNPNIKSVQQLINEKADASAIPTKLSQLTNDSNFITSYTETDPVWTREKANYYTKTEIDNKGYLTAHQSLDAYAKKTEIPNVSTKADLVGGKLKAEQLPKLLNITTAATAEEVVTKFNALLADLKAKGYMEADTPQ